jgi:O-antigen/teichoic acid export membrane protein
MLSSLSKAFQEVVPVRLLKSKLLHQSGFYMLGQILQKAVSFLLLPVWTIYLSPSDYGIMGTLAAYSIILSILLMFGISGAVTRHYFDFREDHEAQRRYVSSNFVFIAVVPGSILAALIFFGTPLWTAVTASPIASNAIPFRPFVVLMLFTVYGGLLYSLPYSLYQAQQKAHKCVSLDLCSFVISVGLSLFLVVGLKKGVYGMMLGSCIASVLTALFASGLLLRQWFVPRLEWRYIQRSLVFGLPIVPHLLSQWALAMVSRVMLQRMVPMDDVGRYTLGYNLGMLMLMIVTSINQAYQPYYFNLMTSSANPQPRILRIILFYLAGMGFIALVGSVFAGELVALMTPARYHASAQYVPPVVVGYFMVGLYYIVSSPIFFHKKTHLLPIITGISAVMNIILNYLLIPRFGAIASAWNTFVCYAFMLVLYYVVAQKMSPFPYPLWRTLLLLAFLIGAILVAESVPIFTPMAWATKAALAGVYLIFSYLLFIKPFRSNAAIKTDSV